MVERQCASQLLYSRWATWLVTQTGSHFFAFQWINSNFVTLYQFRHRNFTLINVYVWIQCSFFIKKEIVPFAPLMTQYKQIFFATKVALCTWYH